MTRTLTALIAALTVGVLAAPVALADERTASSGPVTATLSYMRPADDEYSDLRLTIARAGQVIHDEPLEIDGCTEPYCLPLAALSDGGGGGLTVSDLDADGDPEVIIDVFTGGAHCCTVSEILRFDGARYVAGERNWADPGYRLTDLDGDGRPEFRTADARFAYAFAPFAGSAFPVQVLRYDRGAFADVTRRHRALVRKDARKLKRLYRKHRGEFALGVLAAWTADQYLLGNRRAARRFLARERRAGKLRSLEGWKSGRAYVRQLTRRLRRWGY